MSGNNPNVNNNDNNINGLDLGPNVRPRAPRDGVQIYIDANGKTFTGWLESTIERSLENLAGTFTIPVSQDPTQPPSVVRGDAVVVRIGSTVLVTGYVLATGGAVSRSDSGLSITGRDRTGDLVSCSAIHQGGMWASSSIKKIAADLCKPFGIDVVVAPGTDLGAAITGFKLEHGETVANALARAARLRGVLVTTDGKGKLLITKAGKTRFEGAVVVGENVIKVDDIGSDAERYSHYIAVGQGGGVGALKILSVNATATANPSPAGTTGTTASKGGNRKNPGHKTVVVDPEVRRYLPLIVKAEGHSSPAELEQLATHTMRVKRGHSVGFKYLIEGWTWRGKPWPVNARVAVYDRANGFDGQEMLICSVKSSVTRDKGDTTELLLRPIDAYDTLPIRAIKGKGTGNGTGKILNVPAAPKPAVVKP